MHPAALDEDELLADCQLRRQRRSGPGGQHRNKVETAVVIRHIPTGVEAAASERRSQEENRRVAVSRLRQRLALRVRTGLDPSGFPSKLWRSRCAGGKIVVSPQHSDFPAILAEALDVLAARNANIAEASEFLSCTRSQLTKLLKVEPDALRQVNQQRRAAGLPPLR